MKLRIIIINLIKELKKIKNNLFNIFTTHPQIIFSLTMIVVFMLLIYHNPVIIVEALAEENLDQKNIQEIIKEIQELKERHEELKKNQELTMEEMNSYRRQLHMLYQILNEFCYWTIVISSIGMVGFFV